MVIHLFLYKKKFFRLRNCQKWTDYIHIKYVVMNCKLRIWDKNSGSGQKSPVPDQQHCFLGAKIYFPRIPLNGK